MNNLFNHISWTQYLLGATVLIVIYYVGVLLLFYRDELMSRFRRGGSRKETDQWEEKTDDNPAGELMVDLEGTVEDIAHSILVPGKTATKSELLQQLKVRVANFGGLSRPGYRYALNNFIMEKAETNCGIEFSEQELDEAWDELSR